MPVPVILQAILAVIAAAPQIESLVADAKRFINALFTANLITKAQQDATHAAVDAIVAMSVAGIVPDHWKVEPDPVAFADNPANP